MGQDRLISFALLNIHRNIALSGIDVVYQRTGIKKNQSLSWKSAQPVTLRGSPLGDKGGHVPHLAFPRLLFIKLNNVHKIQVFLPGLNLFDCGP